MEFGPGNHGEDYFEKISHYEETVYFPSANVEADLKVQTLYGGCLEDQELQAVVYRFPDCNGHEDDLYDFVDFSLEAYQASIDSVNGLAVMTVALPTDDRVVAKEFAEEVTDKLDNFLEQGGLRDILG